MLANDGALVCSLDIDSTHIYRRGRLELPPSADQNGGEQRVSNDDAVRKADVIVTGVPSESYKLDVSLVKQGAVVINVASYKNVDERALLSTRPGVRYIGQVGKITVAMLERNLLRLTQNFREEVAKGEAGSLCIGK